jgi:protease IV
LAKLPSDAPVHVEVYPRKKATSEVLSELLGQKGDNSEDDAASVSAQAPFSALMKSVDAVYSLGARMGLFEHQRASLYSPMPRASWE